MIPKSECKHGYLYRIHSRNLAFGVFNEPTGGFIGLRTKFGSIYAFEEFHWDNGEPCGTVQPQEELEKLPEGIEVDESLGSVCGNCKRIACMYSFLMGLKTKPFHAAMEQPTHQMFLANGNMLSPEIAKKSSPTIK